METWQEKRHSRIGRIQDLSYRIGRLSPPMKPFVRFACPTLEHSASFWDFDDLLQKRLLLLLLEIAAPEDIPGINIERWKRNLAHLLQLDQRPCSRGTALGEGVLTGRHAKMAGCLQPGQRVLYVGCGTGTECFQLGKEGFRVTGIDAFSELLFPAGVDAGKRGVSVRFSAMDMSALGFRDRVFDGFLLELYGFLPPGHQNMQLLRELGRVLIPGGTGFVVALRKAYASHWYRGCLPFPPGMARWLVPQSALDFRCADRDVCEERLVDGFYNRSHTVDTLSAELSTAFEVLSCDYEEDPRYVVAVVRPRDGGCLAEESPENVRGPAGVVQGDPAPVIDGMLDRVEAVCDMMAGHAAEVSAFFNAGGAGRDCLRQVRPDLEQFTRLLASLSFAGTDSDRCGLMTGSS